MFLSCFFSQG